MDYTFVLGYNIEDCKNICVIVCNSSSPIDEKKVCAVATSYFNFGISTKKNAKEVLDCIVDGIKRDCGIDALLIASNVACKIGSKM